MRRKRRAGFTLIELLVVIAVISVLAALLFPVFASARQKARQAACLSNERQLAMAVMMYVQDNDEILPGATDGRAGAGVLGGWMFYSSFAVLPGQFSAMDPAQGSLYPYVRSKGVYLCPNDTARLPGGNSYAINSCVAAPDAVGGLHVGRTLGAFDAPGAIMLFGEETTPTADTTNDAYMNLAYGDTFAKHHQNGTDVAFLDAHVKWYPVTAIHVQGVQTGTPGDAACP